MAAPGRILSSVRSRVIDPAVLTDQLVCLLVCRIEQNATGMSAALDRVVSKWSLKGLLVAFAAAEDSISERR